MGQIKLQTATAAKRLAGWPAEPRLATAVAAELQCARPAPSVAHTIHVSLSYLIGSVTSKVISITNEVYAHIVNVVTRVDDVFTRKATLHELILCMLWSMKASSHTP